jgi:hypothetical protein
MTKLGDIPVSVFKVLRFLNRPYIIARLEGRVKPANRLKWGGKPPSPVIFKVLKSRPEVFNVDHRSNDVRPRFDFRGGNPVVHMSSVGAAIFPN